MQVFCDDVHISQISINTFVKSLRKCQFVSISAQRKILHMYVRTRVKQKWAGDHTLIQKELALNEGPTILAFT